MLPVEIRGYIVNRNEGTLKILIKARKREEDRAWAEFGLAECWRLGEVNEKNYKGDLKKASSIYLNIINNTQLSISIKQYAHYALAECFRVGADDFGHDLSEAKVIYHKILTDEILSKNLPEELKRWSLFGQADCIVRSQPHNEQELKKAFELYFEFLRAANYPQFLLNEVNNRMSECLTVNNIKVGHVLACTVMDIYVLPERVYSPQTIHNAQQINSILVAAPANSVTNTMEVTNPNEVEFVNQQSTEFPEMLMLQRAFIKIEAGSTFSLSEESSMECEKTSRSFGI